MGICGDVLVVGRIHSRVHAPVAQIWLSVRDGSFWSKSKIELSVLLKMTWHWSQKRPPGIEELKAAVGIKSDHTIVDWFNFLRDVTQDW